MAALFLRESDIDRLLTMQTAVEMVSTVFRKQAMTETANISRGRALTDHGLLHVMGAAAKTLGAMCCKVCTSTKERLHSLVHYYDGRTGELLAIMQADRLGDLRAGATSAVATQHMARADARTVGVLGSGRQARTQLEGVCAVRAVTSAVVYSPDAAGRAAFAEEMSQRLQLDVQPVDAPELAAREKDIVITATTSVDPFLAADWIAEGTHLNAVGSNFLHRAELVAELVGRADPIVVDDKEQARMEAGDLANAVEEKVIRWSDVIELGNVVVGQAQGRYEPTDVTLFKSVGAALEDLAVAKAVYELALEKGVGERLPF